MLFAQFEGPMITAAKWALSAPCIIAALVFVGIPVTCFLVWCIPSLAKSVKKAIDNFNGGDKPTDPPVKPA